MDGYINCDLDSGPSVDMQFDCQKEWPFPDESVKEIYCSHTLEHLYDHMSFFRHAWRVMEPMGEMLIRVPYGLSTAAMSDMTHVRPWYPGSFASLQPGYDKVANGNHYQDNSFPFWVIDTMIVVPGWAGRLCKWHYGRQLVWWMTQHLYNVGGELWASLQKTLPESAVGFNSAGTVPICFGVWKDHLDNKKTEAGRVGSIVRFPLYFRPGWK